ncbi:S-layer homology domain-containing protein [Cohnella rhizosphaerae]|uniref:S-layer homology domain-containing protein n=1 Tax=Cohnella rhizosphaerae TaxID=1457232 RepID=A0A9X4KYA0_9BACL|nr:S-layer homology domain-containing protein [Cohnella rhizosphaerae]MDG0813050.1 S-layer homology domain-containing protein [Cohnella rhizosphaerae]
MSLKPRNWLLSILMIALVWTGAAVAGPAQNASAASKTPFTDVVAGHWAEKHIAKLALQGLIAGKGANLFAPNDSVKRQDAVIIAIRFLGLEQKALDSGVAAFPSTFSVSAYANLYVSYALKEGLLDRTEEFALAEAQPKVNWGEAPATREWIARLLVRTIGEKAAAGTTAFADNASIDKDLVGYVKAAVDLDLVKGLSGNTFAPKGVVTRATAATLFSRAEAAKQVAYPKQTSGMLLAADASAVTVLQANGTATAYAVGAGTLYSRLDSEALTAQDALKVYGTVNVIAAADGSAAYVEQASDTPMVKTVQGKLVVVSASKSAITLLSGEDVQSYSYDPARMPAVTDAENNKVALADLPENADLTLTIDTYTQSGKVIAVKTGQSAVSRSGTGTVLSVDAAGRKLQVKDNASSIADTRALDPNAVLRTVSGVPAAIGDIKVGDTVAYEIKGGLYTAVTVTKSAVAASATGTLFKIDTAAQTIQYRVGGASDIIGKEYVAGVAVKISGLNGATLADLYPGDAVTLTLNAEGKVTAVEATGRSVQVQNGLVVSSYDFDAKVLILKDAAGNVKTFTLGAGVRYDLNGTTISADAGTSMLYKGRKVDIGYSGSNIVSISFVAQYKGTVTSNNTTTKTLQLLLDNNSNVTVPYTSPTVEIFGQTNRTYADIKTGDKIVALLDGGQNYAVALQVVKTVQFDVVSVDAAAAKLKAKATDGSVAEWTVGTGFSLQDASGNAAQLSGLVPGTLLNVTLQGATPTLAKIVPSTFGRVVAIDTAAGTIDLRTGTGAAVKQTVGATPLVVRNGVSSNTLSAVQLDDRIELRKDENDRTILNVVTPVSKTYWRTDKTTNTFYYQKESLSDDNYSVALSPQVYIHQGDTLITTDSLNFGDPINVYVLRGKAIEIVKP